MSSSPTSNIKFAVISAITLLATAGALAALWPSALSAARTESAWLTTNAKTAGRGEATADYQLAVWLNSDNQTAHLHLATAQIAAGQSAAALVNLSQAGEGTVVTTAKVRALIETGAYQQAATTATTLTNSGAPNSQLVLAGLANALAGQSATVSTLAARVTSPDAVQALARSQAGKIPLAAELAANGLLNGSSALLASLPVSYERNFLLARINYARHTTTGLNQATTLLEQAVSLDPSNLPARQLLVRVFRDQDNTAGLSTQSALVAKLSAGHP